MKTLFTGSLSIISIILIPIFLLGFKDSETKKGLKETSGGDLSFTVRTVTAGGNYAPKHVLVIWIEDNGAFVKTRLLRGNARKQYLYTWKASTTAAGSPYNVVDAITGATLTSHTTHTVSWDCRDLDGNIVPDGEYSVWVEFTDKHDQGPLYSISFTKGPDAINTAPADETYFKDIALVFTPISAEFISSATQVCQNENITFTDASVNASEWVWEFGQGASPASANTEGPHIVTYSSQGFKTVSLTINGNLTETKEACVEVVANPVADFGFTGMDFTVQFTNNSTNAESYVWDFGDGNTSIEANPSHIYAEAGSYMVTLEANNTICADEIVYEVQVPIVGLHEIAEEEGINIFPNPNNGSFTIDIGSLKPVYEILVLDLTGKRVVVDRSNIINNSLLTIDLLNPGCGIYFLQVVLENKIISSKFVIR
jgi:PKD repeat protein